MASFYDTLGVAKNASPEEIKKAYRRLARQYHPDRNPGDAAAEAKFKDVQGAYDVLSDPDKRKQYDAFGNGRIPGGGAGAPGGFNVDFGNIDLGDIGDLFGGLFGRGAREAGAGPQRRRPAEKGDDVEAIVTVSFEDSLKGVQTQIPVELVTACSECGGSGAQPGTAPVICPECNGRGVTSESQGLFALSQPCPRCRGNGTVIEKPCPRCSGSGRERRTKRYSVRIPAGVKDGTRIRLAGKGELGSGGGPAGDLYVVTRVTPSPLFQRRGTADLEVEVPVTYAEAALGASVDVPSPYGDRLSIKVPPGSETGKLLRLKGHGAPKLKASGRGDLIAKLRLTVPKKLTKKQKQLLEEYARATHEEPREEVFS